MGDVFFLHFTSFSPIDSSGGAALELVDETRCFFRFPGSPFLPDSSSTRYAYSLFLGYPLPLLMRGPSDDKTPIDIVSCIPASPHIRFCSSSARPGDVFELTPSWVAKTTFPSHSRFLSRTSWAVSAFKVGISVARPRLDLRVSTILYLLDRAAFRTLLASRFHWDMRLLWFQSQAVAWVVRVPHHLLGRRDPNFLKSPIAFLFVRYIPLLPFRRSLTKYHAPSNTRAHCRRPSIALISICMMFARYHP